MNSSDVTQESISVNSPHSVCIRSQDQQVYCHSVGQLTAYLSRCVYQYLFAEYSNNILFIKKQ